VTHGDSKRRAELALVGVTAIWGSTFVVVKQALDDASPIVFLGFRFCLATFALGILFRRHRPTAAGWVAGILAGAFLYISYVLQTVGLRFTTPPKSAFLTGLAVPAVPFLTAIVYRNKPRGADLFGALMATTGLALMTLRSDSWEVNQGDLLTLGCAITFAAHIVTVGHFSTRVSFESLAWLQMAVAAILSLGTFWWVETPFVQWSFGLCVAVVITGLFATALAFTVQAWAQQYTTAPRAALIFTLEPVIAWVVSYALTRESLSLQAAGGAALILAGIVLVELKPPQAQQHPSE
jgi:drug/metabolite transporter (DMT)-like permease